jgi:hypothetical protein
MNCESSRILYFLIIWISCLFAFLLHISFIYQARLSLIYISVAHCGVGFVDRVMLGCLLVDLFLNLLLSCVFCLLPCNYPPLNFKQHPSSSTTS